ncbi:hypothetical protein D3C85_1148190 [compost metagenome]
MTLRSGPAILMPTGVLMPVANMSMRVLMGGTQALVRPGKRIRESSSSLSFSGVMPGRHWSRGLSWMLVSIITRSAGSVAESARPALPNTFCTSGRVRMSLSVCCKISRALPTEILAAVVGIYMMSPSSSGGINSEPRYLSGQKPATVTTAATIRVVFGRASTAPSSGI